MLTHYYEQLAQTQSRGDTITVTTLQDLFYQVIFIFVMYKRSCINMQKRGELCVTRYVNAKYT